MCATWDFTQRAWITNGCITIVGEDGIITCECNHLTNFAVLVVNNNVKHPSLNILMEIS